MPRLAESKILGGAFPLETPGSAMTAPLCLSEAQYFLSVRCALSAICGDRKPGAAWLPSHLCPSLTEPFARAFVCVRYYPVNHDLQVADTGWIGEIQPGDLVLVIHYFGFPNASFPSGSVASRGAILVEDSSQALFLGPQFPESQYIVYSPRKFLGVPDGGLLVARGENRLDRDLLEPPQDWWRMTVAMTMKRREFDLTGCPNDLYELFQQVESGFPVGPYRASDLSRMLIRSADYESVRAARRRNYARLLSRLHEFALSDELPEDIVPLGFPVRVQAEIRDPVLAELHAARIYAPVHWPGSEIPGCLTLICDQRCSARDMDRQADVFLAAVSREAARTQSDSACR